MQISELPKNNAELDKRFLAGAEPQLSEFGGEYWVDMLTGPIPNLRRLSHRKTFSRGGSKVVGHNVLFKNLIWGRFFLKKTVCAEMNSVSVVEINYDRPENFISRPIRDRIRRIDSDLYLGRFYYVIFGKPRFLAYFTLTKA